MRRDSGFTLIELMAVIVIIALLLSLLLAVIPSIICNGRQSTMAVMLQQLSEAAEMYESDWNGYPPDDAGFRSCVLVEALEQQEGSARKPYFEFHGDQLDSEGNIVNLAAPAEFIRYRRNAPNHPGNRNDPSAHNKTSVDLWGRDCLKREDGVNNWGP